MAKEETDDEGNEGEENAKPNKKLLIMIIIGAVALVILSGLSVYLIMSDGGDKPAESSEVSEEEKPQDVDDKGNPLPALYFPIKPPFLASLPPDSSHKMLQVSMEVMTRNPEIVAFLKDNDPMVKHHLLNLLNAQNPEELKSRAGKEKLQEALAAKIEELAKEMGIQGKVAKIYFTRMIME